MSAKGPHYQELELVASASRTSSSTSATTETMLSRTQEGGDLVVYLNVSAASGSSPTLDVQIKGRVGGDLYTLASFTQATAATKQRVVVPDAPNQIRIDWTIGGTTPDFTFEVFAHRSY